MSLVPATVQYDKVLRKNDTAQVAIKLSLLRMMTGKPSRYITNTKVNSAFYPSGVSKLSTSVSD